MISLMALGCGGGNTPAASQPAAASQAAAAITCPVTGGSGTAASIVDFNFQPSAISVAVNGQIDWTNTGAVTHTVTFDNGPDCGHVAAGAKVSAKFSAPGTYAFHCAIHPAMK